MAEKLTRICCGGLQALIYVQYQPGKSITVTGNDDIWLYINGEVLSSAAVVVAHTLPFPTSAGLSQWLSEPADGTAMAAVLTLPDAAWTMLSPRSNLPFNSNGTIPLHECGSPCSYDAPRADTGCSGPQHCCQGICALLLAMLLTAYSLSLMLASHCDSANTMHGLHI